MRILNHRIEGRVDPSISSNPRHRWISDWQAALQGRQRLVNLFQGRFTRKVNKNGHKLHIVNLVNL
jgi:hypothetical protein